MTLPAVSNCQRPKCPADPRLVPSRRDFPEKEPVPGARMSPDQSLSPCLPMPPGDGTGAIGPARGSLSPEDPKEDP